MSNRARLYPRYAIGWLLLNEFQRQDISRAELARRMGYTNPIGALRRFDNLVRGGAVPASIIVRFARALGLEPAIVDKAVAETEEQIRVEQEEARRQREADERATFRPYVVIETSRGLPQPVHIGIMFYTQLKQVAVPHEVTERPIGEQIGWVGRRVAAHFIERKGSAAAFGDITGYAYRRTYDRAITFDVHGQPSNYFAARPPEGRGSLSVKGKPFVTSGP